MAIFAEMVLEPGHIVTWIAVGLIAGWLACKALGGGTGLIFYLVLGLVGASAGGFLIDLLMGGDAGFGGSLAAAILGSCVFLAACRLLRLGQGA
jgi:uncharacterized membrane protein YeaQ/YmgE (transglycosylase-associated protein family)